MKRGILLSKKWHTICQKGAAVVILLAILASFWVGYERICNENKYKNINIIINETDLRSFANGNNMDIPTMLKTLKSHGISQILFKEASLGGLANEGKIGIYQGANVYDSRDVALLPKMDINDASRYVVIYDKAWQEQIKREVMGKVRNVNLYKNPSGFEVLEVPTMIAQTPQETESAKAVVDDIGVGYDKNLMKQVADAGMGVIPQIRTWSAVDDHSLKMLREDLQSIPNISLIMMNDKTLPGYPDQLRALATIFSKKNGEALAPLGIVEFSKQPGLERLGILMNKQVVRVHTITNAEMSKFEGVTDIDRALGEKAALDRWKLAAKEREMRCLLVRFFDMSEPNFSFKDNMAYLDNLNNSLKADGFQVGEPYQSLQMPSTPEAVLVLIGLGISAGLFLLLDVMGFPIVGLILAALLTFGFAGLLFIKPVISVKIMALLSVMIFPTYSGIKYLPKSIDKRLSKAIARLLMMSAVSFIGAILMVGMLSSTLFMLKLDQFVGVKIAHIIPLLAVPIFIYIWNTDNPKEMVLHLCRKALDYRWAGLFLILIGALVIYLMRTGNTTVELSNTEMGMRQWLTDFLGVRPRSKEFLIGYPITLVYFLWAKNRRSFWILTVPVMIGQVSLVNTYAHIHTPLLISLWRSFNGLLGGIIIGIVLVLILRMFGVLWYKYIKNFVERGSLHG